MVATFLDCAPVVFSPSGTLPENELRSITAVAQISRTLYGSLLQAPGPVSLSLSFVLYILTNPQSTSCLDVARENLGTVLGYMTPYFPFGTNASRDVKVR